MEQLLRSRHRKWYGLQKVCDRKERDVILIGKTFH